MILRYDIAPHPLWYIKKLGAAIRDTKCANSEIVRID